MPRKGLGKGLDSLIPDIYDENFDSNSTPSLEDMLNDNEPETPKEPETPEEETPKEEEKPSEDKNIFEEIEEEDDDVEEDKPASEGSEGSGEEIPEEETEEETREETKTSEDLPGDSSSEEPVQTPQEVPKIQVNLAHVDEVKEIVNKNPRITLWSARSSAVFRYLRKTEPEFSISKEASTLIDEAVSKKYPEIWKLFEEF